MQVEIMDHQDLRKLSHLLHDMHFPSEKQVGMRNSKADHQGLRVRKQLVATEEGGVQSIENILPDEDDLFSGLINEIGCTAHVNGSEDDEDFDLFSTGGGMELEGNCRLQEMRKKSGLTEELFVDEGSSSGSLATEHPSRTLVVRNIDSNIEDSELRILFEQFGDIQTLYTACRYQGFVMVSYYDIRAAWKAKSALQNKLVRNGKLDVHYSIPKVNLSGKHIDQASLEMCGPTQNHKLAEEYDIRAAEVSVHELNRSYSLSEPIKLELNHTGNARSMMQQQFFPETMRGEMRFCQSPKDILLPEAAVSPVVFPTSCKDNGYIYRGNSAREMAIKPFTEKPLTQVSGCYTNGFSSPAANPSATQFGPCNTHHSLDQTKLQSHYTSFNPNNNGFVDNGVVTYDSLSNFEDFKSDLGSNTVQEMNGKHLYAEDSMCPPAEHLGYLGTGSFQLNGHHHVQSNSNTFQHHPVTPMTWSSPPQFVNGVSDSSYKLPVLFEVLPHVLYTVSPSHKHPIRSAPSGSVSCGGLRHTYTGESPKPLDFQLDPRRIVGFPATSVLCPPKVASHNGSHFNGNCMSMSSNSAMSSPKNKCQIFPGRESVTPRANSVISTKERMKKHWRRKLEAESCDADQKKYELDIERVLCGEDSRTTLMIKNIPNKYTSKTLLAAIDEHNRGTYDFIYLPIDFKNNCNMGYAFINMVDPLQIVPFYKNFNGKKWEKFHSNKVATLAYARIQGRAALIAHFQDSSLMNEDKFCHPILFVSDGPNAGDQEPFPIGTCTNSRQYKPRGRVNKENQSRESPDKEEETYEEV